MNEILRAGRESCQETRRVLSHVEALLGGAAGLTPVQAAKVLVILLSAAEQLDRLHDFLISGESK